MNHLTQIKPKNNPNQLLAMLRKADAAKADKLKSIALSDPKAWAAGAVNDEIGKHLSQLGTDAMYKMAAIAEGMLGYYLDYYREVEKIELDFSPILDRMNPSKKERKQLADSLKWAKEKLERNFANFYVTNKQMVDMCNRVDEAQQEKLQDIEDEIYDGVVQQYNTKHARIETYLEPAPQEGNFLMGCKEIAAYLALQSKGALYLTPQEVSKALASRNFIQSDYSTAYFVKIK